MLAVPRLLATSHMVVRDATTERLGVGLLPAFQAREGVEARRLVRVLTDWGWHRSPVHAVFPSNRFLSPAVRAFVDAAVQGFRADVEAGSGAD